MTPRPATEALVTAALARIHGPARVADAGTGTGAVAVAIAVSAPEAEVWATDVDPAAVELARRNATRHGVGARVHVRRADLLDGVPGGLDLVVANLPYLPEEEPRPEYEGEPAGAVYAPGDGLSVYRRLAGQAEDRLTPGGALLIQLHARVLAAERGCLGSLFDETVKHG